MPLADITRREHFSAAHRLHSRQLSDAENERVFGKCNWAHGHGHNYQVEVTVRGPIDPRTGMVMNIVDLKRAMRAVLDRLDHRHLDRDVRFFRDHCCSTTENLAVYIWRRLQRELHGVLLAGAARLHRVRIWETDSNQVEYFGDCDGDLDDALFDD